MMKYVVVVVVLIVLLGGGYFLYQNMNTGAPPGTESPTSDTVQAQDITVGTGAQATPNSIVSVLYVGRLSDGTVFDSSEAHGNQPLIFQLGAPGIIPGFQIGVNGMLVGGERRMAVPPTLGYGGEDVKDPSGKVLVAANSTLIFDVKLLKVEAAPASTTAPGVQ